MVALFFINCCTCLKARVTLFCCSPTQPLGPAAARAKLLESNGYKAVLISTAEWAGLADSKAKAKHLLTAVQKAVPSAYSKVRVFVSCCCPRALPAVYKQVLKSLQG